MDKQESHIKYKALKMFLIGLTLFVGIQLLGRYMLTTKFVHNYVKAKVETLANEKLNAKLEIGELDGDLWKEVLLTDVSVSNNDPIFTADTLYANYNIWSFLKNVYIINEIRIAGVNSFITEKEDSVFNVQQMIKEDGVGSEDQTMSDPIKLRLLHINLRDFNSKIFSPSYLPDSVLSINNMNASASLVSTDSLIASLSSLSFLIEEGRLPEPIKVKTSGKLIEERITLEEMIVETGRSIVKAKATANSNDSTFSAEASTSPFSLKDIQPYLDAEIPDDELDLEISMSGSLNDLRLKVNLNHEYANNIELIAGLNLKETITITKFMVQGAGVNLAHFTNDSINVEFGNFNFSLLGMINENIPSADIKWGLSFNKIQYEEYFIDRLIANGTLNKDTFVANIGINPHLREKLNLTAKVYSVSTDSPKWRTDFNVNEFDISNWVDTGDLNSLVTFNGYVEGQGVSLSQNPWQYSIQSVSNKSILKSSQTQVAGQSLKEYKFNGSISEEVVDSEGFITFNRSRLDFEFDAVDIFSSIPLYSYFISTSGFDLSELNQTSDFPTYLNMDIYGEGKGFDPENSLIFANLKIDSSVVNGSKFESLETFIELNNGILSINDGILRSDIIEGNFSGRKNITNEIDPENWLLLDMLVKNTQPLAPLLNVEVLSAVGEIKGRVTQDTSNVLRGNMEIDFENIIIDTTFTASRISGKTDVIMSELRQFNLKLSIESPIISGITFQDIELVSEGVGNTDTLQSEFSLDIVGSDRGKLIQSGSLNINFIDELLDIKFDRFNFISPETELALQRPFNVRINNTSISTDTLDLKSDSGSYLELSIPYADSLEQYGWFKGKNFDFGIIQEVIFGESFLDGVLSGQMFFNRSPEDITGSGSFYLTNITYGEVVADSLDITFDLRQKRLFANALVSWDEEEKVIGNLNVPFVIADVSELDDDFFKQPVEGSLTINPSKITKFKGLLDDFGIAETDGVLSFNGSISGTVGEPNFEGAFLLNDPVLSGIKVDTVSADFSYDNIQGGLQVQSKIIAARQKAAEIAINYPFQYDFRSFQIILPDEEETIKVTAKTENFNIAVFNDFLNKDYLNGLSGTLNANLILEGTVEKMAPKGFLRLSNGKVSVPIAGITLDGVKSDVEFTQFGLRVKEISAKSGRGNFNANGTIQLEGIFPKTVDLNARANQFRLANTDDYNIVIDLNGKLSGLAQTPMATGKLTIRNGFVYLQDFGEDTIEEVVLEGEEISSFSPYDSLSIEMEVEIQRDFYIRNRTYLDMEIELIGQLDAQKETNGELSLFGSLNGIQGYVRPLGKTFKMEEANFTFSGPVDNPDLSIKSKYTPPTRQKGESVELYYLIDGTAQNPEFSFDSNPPMEQSDIICYTLFGKPCYSLESWQSVFTSGGSPSATDVLTDVLLDEVEALATRELGVDVVQIDNSGASGGTSIKTGWYINQRTFFAIINELTGSTPRTLFTLEYILSENWDLIVTQGGDTRRGIDFRYQYDY